MMNILFLSLIILFHIPALAQIDPRINEYQKGQIENDEKIGVWEYYGFNNELDLKVNHDNSAILYLKPDTTDYYVNINNQWMYTKLDHYPRYLGSYYEFYSILQRKLRAPKEVTEKQTDHIIYLVFDINTDGQAVNVHAENDEEGLFHESVLKAFNLIPNSWIPASLNQLKLTSRLVLPLIIKYMNSKTNLQFDESSDKMPEGRRLEEITMMYSQTFYKDQL